MTTKLIFLGGGNMAEAIFASLVENREFIIEVIQRNEEKCQRLAKLYPSIKITKTLEYKPAKNDIVVLAIKPQNAKESCIAIKDKLSDCILMSVMAGIPINTISSWIDNQRIIRTMPNTPGSIKQGVTAIFFSHDIEDSTRNIVQSVFAEIGMVYTAQEEAEINKIIPVSSSAVAFIYYFMEGMINTAVKEYGFSQEAATEIVKKTVLGSSALLESNLSLSLEEQRLRVTSKKGTTEQGVMTLENLNLHGIISEAMKNCYNRALEMSKEFD